jgi:hypothetical protein
MRILYEIQNTSETLKIDFGVPQGSKLGPLLFILYINDIVKTVVNCKIKLFADDSLLYTECDDVNDVDLESIYDYLCLNNLALNLKKTKGMIISRKSYEGQLNTIHVKNKIIDLVEEIKYLGIIIDNKLKFKTHLEYVIKKYHMLRRLEGKINDYNKITLYKSLIAPHIEYFSTVLFLLTETQINKLQKIQNKSMRLILRAKYDTPNKTMIDILQFMTVKERINFNTIKFLYKIENGQAPNYMKKKINKKETMLRV